MSISTEDIKHYFELFDRGVDRRGSKSWKWDANMSNFGSENVIPMGTADTDFMVPETVREALVSRAMHGAFGYTIVADSDLDAVAGWMNSRHNTNVGRECVTLSPGVIDSLNVAVCAYTEPGDLVAIQTPVYGPFYGVVKNNGRRLYESPLIHDENGWRMDLGNLEEGFKSGAKMMILCSPHNPLGRVWRREELEALHDLCERYGVMVVSDEIHSDVILPGHTQTPWITIDPKGVTCISATKAFNIAALRCSSVIIPDNDKREQFRKEFRSRGIDGINLFGVLAQTTAYQTGADWLDALCLYIDENRKLAESYLSEHRPEFSFSHIEGTYLLWLDMRCLGLDEPELRKWCAGKGVGLVQGTAFGENGRGFMRMNIATPRSNLMKALELLCAE